MRQLLDVVYQTEELPLRIHFRSPAQREAVEFLVVADVGEDRFHRGEASSVERTPLWAVDRPLHDLGVAHFAARRPPTKEADLPGLRRLGFPQTPVALVARHAIAQRALELYGDETVVIAVRPVLVERLARRADAGAGVRVVVEILWPVVAGGLLRVRLVVERIGLGLVLCLVLEALIALPHLVVGDQGRSVPLGQRLEVGFTVVAGVRGDERVRRTVRCGGLDHREQQCLLAAAAMGLSLDDDLVPVIDGGDAHIALDDALAGGHLGRFVVCAVALHHFAFGALAVFRVGSEPLTHPGGFRRQTVNVASFFRRQVGFDRQGVVLAMTGEHGLGGGFHLVGLALEVGTGAASGLAGVARQLDADQRPEGSPLGGWRTSRGR